MEAQPFMTGTKFQVRATENVDNKTCQSFAEKLKDNLLLILTLFGVCVGFALGFGLRQHDLSDSGLMWLGRYTWLYVLY